MQSCQVCGNPVTESIEQETGRTMSGAKEIDPTAGTKRFWGGKWYHFDTLVCRSKFEKSHFSVTLKNGLSKTTIRYFGPLAKPDLF